MSCLRGSRTQRLVAFAIVLITSGALAASYAPQNSGAWELVWSDEFDGAANTPPDPNKWTYDLGNGGNNPGWGNHELQRYTDSTMNVFQDGQGRLVIRAIRAGDQYTSGRIKTQGKFSAMYGRVEARIKMPYAMGTWPAFWMLGDAFPKTPWPACGEIDIMENFGEGSHDSITNHGTLHGPGYPGTGITAKYRAPDGKALADDFHVFSIEWAPGSVEFFLDGNSYRRVTAKDMPAGGRWVFDGTPFFMLLNLAVGGSPAPVGYPGSDTPFPQEMIVDYIRVYQERK